MMDLSSTQIGAIAENLAANELMIQSNGRLSPFQPIADDDGIDVLIYDKVTGLAIPIQIKARTNTIHKAGTQNRGSIVHFEVRKATHRDDRRAMLLGILLDGSMRSAARAWLMPLAELRDITSERKEKYVIRANKNVSSADKYRKYQCADMAEVADRLIKYFEAESRNKTARVESV